MCRPATWLLGDISRWNCGVATFPFAAVYLKFSLQEKSHTRARAQLLLVTFIYSFVFHLFLYFLKHKTVKTAVEERALVSQPVKSAMYLSPSEPFFISLSVLTVSIFFIVQPVSTVVEHLALHSICQFVVFAQFPLCCIFVDIVRVFFFLFGTWSSSVTCLIHLLTSKIRSYWYTGVTVWSKLNCWFCSFPIIHMTLQVWHLFL